MEIKNSLNQYTYMVYYKVGKQERIQNKSPAFKKTFVVVGRCVSLPSLVFSGEKYQNIYIEEGTMIQTSAKTTHK